MHFNLADINIILIKGCGNHIDAMTADCTKMQELSIDNEKFTKKLGIASTFQTSTCKIKF